MTYHLIIKEEVEKETIEAFVWYECRQQGLGNDFLLQLEEHLNNIVNQPFLYQKIYKQFRQVFLKRFPFVIIYEIDANTIIVYSIFHTSRNPKKKFRKSNDHE